jgi:hypothetical protein
MKYISVELLITTALVILLSSCESSSHKEERLAKQYCGSCHLFPEPGLLNKNTWEKSILPQMGFRMGLNPTMLSEIPSDDKPFVFAGIPENPMVDEKHWESIKNFYLTNAPDSIIASTPEIKSEIDQFEITPLRLPLRNSALITLIHNDTLNHKIYIGNRFSKLYKLNQQFSLLDSFQLKSPPSAMITPANQEPLVLMMGIMDPNEQSKGALASLNLSSHELTKILDSLQRPVHFVKANLNKDSLQDFVICAFGNYTGALLAFEKTADGFKGHVLQYLPGARKVIVNDFDGNGLNDIMVLMSQGDERILLLYNQGNFNFRPTTVLRLPPVYGSSYFEVADFNKDGKFDILLSNGDNADYSSILKPYHGLRIFLNDGSNGFKESWFYNMHGASQTISRDFDNDGDIDIAAISFFPDFNHPEQGFIYFENTPQGYTPKITHQASVGRWLVMEAIDLEQDGDDDIVLGALNFNTGVPASLYQQWSANKIPLLVFKNKLH